MTGESCKISVIVPVYNKEAYLRECVDSILSQDYQNMEVILVDDASTDDSGRICDDYGQRDARVSFGRGDGAGVQEAVAGKGCQKEEKLIFFAGINMVQCTHTHRQIRENCRGNTGSAP